MLKVFPLPAIIEKFARRRVVNVAVFGNGISTVEWPQLRASFWHHHENFSVNLVDDPAEADVLAVHGPLTSAAWPFFVRWMSTRNPRACVIAVGMEVETAGGRIVAPVGEVSSYTVDAILPGHPPTPAALKASLFELMSRGSDV